MGKLTEAKLSAFWKWFEKNQTAYWEMDHRFLLARRRLFNELHARLQKIDPDLTFELSPVIEGKCELVISAGGIKRAFPAVASLVAAAPTLPGWKITAFRPRRLPVSCIEYEGLRLDPGNIYVQVIQDDSKLGLRIFVPGYTVTEHGKFGGAGYVLLDEALGEYDVETKVSGVDFQPLGAAPPPNSVTLNELAALFDRLFLEICH
jgi:hypothetical protein